MYTLGLSYEKDKHSSYLSIMSSAGENKQTKKQHTRQFFFYYTAWVPGINSLKKVAQESEHIL